MAIGLRWRGLVAGQPGGSDVLGEWTFLALGKIFLFAGIYLICCGHVFIFIQTPNVFGSDAKMGAVAGVTATAERGWRLMEKQNIM